MLVPSPGLTAPNLVQSSPRLRSRSRSRSPVPKRAPTRRGSILLSEGGSSTGLVLKCCPQVPPERVRVSRQPLLPCHRRQSVSTVRARCAPASLHPPVAQPGRQNPSDAAEARRRSRDKRRRRREIYVDDDEHNTGNPLLLLCAHALVAPALQSGFAELHELSIALSCCLPLDTWMIMQ